MRNITGQFHRSGRYFAIVVSCDAGTCVLMVGTGGDFRRPIAAAIREMSTLITSRSTPSLWDSSLLAICVDGVDLPAHDLLHRDVPALAEKADATILWFILAGGGHGGLAIVGKDFHQILVDEDAQGEVYGLIAGSSLGTRALISSAVSAVS